MNLRKVNQGRKVLSNLFSGVGVEVGVERGKFSEVILESCDFLYLVDLWKNYPGYREHVSDVEYEEIFQDCRRRLKNKPVEFLRMDSLAAADTFKDGALNFAYLDSLHTYEHVSKELRAWWPKVKVGGFMAGHDYVDAFGKKDGSKYGVIKAVNEFCEEYDIDELVIWAADRNPSWSIAKTK